MVIKELKQTSASICKNLCLLLSELREDAREHTTTQYEIKSLVKDKNVALVVIDDKNKIVGMATLYVLNKLGKRVAHVEDVVVKSEYRGQGLGRKLMTKIIALARIKKVKSLSLTSRPERKAANKLYKSLGFEIKKTNVYRMKL